METASRALVMRRYFACERTCLEALERAFIAGDYERMSRILLPLEEARRQKRDLAVDTGQAFLVDGEVPTGRALRPGCYLVAPPRVGVDGRLLREAADKKRVPTIIVVREPTTRDGLWPVVAIGPVTIRAKVPPPPSSNGHAPKKTPRRTRPALATTAAAPAPAAPLPPPEWFLRANELLGDRALAGLPADAPPINRVEALMKLLQAHPDHEKMHQALAEACRVASKVPIRVRRPRLVRQSDAGSA